MIRPTKVVAVASGGGHWVQLLRLRPAFADAQVSYVSVSAAYETDLDPGDVHSFHAVTDATEWQRLKMIQLFLQLGWVMVRVRPRVVITTGAAPGLLALAWGRAIGARTMWIDSIANVENLSKSGRLARRFAHRVLTQWPELAGDGVDYEGAVL